LGRTAGHNLLHAASSQSPESSSPGAPSIAILYPVRARLRDGTEIVIRPIGPEDAEREQAFVRSLSPESRYFRFMNTLRELSPEMLHRFTHPDLQHEVALVALVGEGAGMRQIGVARFVADAEGGGAEFAIVIGDEWHNRGVGSRLMRELMRSARALGIQRLWGDILATNQRMLSLMTALGFELHSAPADPLLKRASLSLN